MKIKLPSKLFLLGLVLTATLLWPLFVSPYFKSQDDIQIGRLYEMDKCIRDLQIPCRWVPDLGAGYGYPLFNYYGPLPYYYGEIFYLLIGSLTFSVKVMFATSFLGGYFFMYLLGKKLWGEYGGVLSAVFYSFAPYHAVDFYVRGAMNELWALMFYPLIFWSVLKLKESLKVKDVLVLALAIFGLVTTHNLSTMIFAPFLVIFTLVLIFMSFNLKLVRLILIGLILGLTLSAFYFIPTVFEKNLVHIDTTTIGYFSYTEHFKGFRKMILDRRWAYGPSVREVPGGEKDTLSYQIGTVHVASLIFALMLLGILLRKDKRSGFYLILFAGFTAFSAFMVNNRSLSIWQLFEPLKYLQFPWRFLGLVIFFISLACGSIFLSIEKIKSFSNKLKIYFWLVLIFALFLLNFSYFKPEKFIYLGDRELLSGDSFNYQITRSIFDFLPKSAKAPPAKIAENKYEINPYEVDITNYREGSNWIKFDANVKSLAYIGLSKYYFPNWQVRANGKLRKINHSNELGLITFTLDPGRYNVEIKLSDTSIRVASNVISGVALMIFLVLVLTQFPKSRKWVLYYINRIN